MPLIPPPKTYPTRPFKAGRTSAQADWLPVEITDPPCDDLSFCSTDCLGDVQPSLQPHIVSLRQLVVLSRKPSRHSLVSHHTRPVLSHSRNPACRHCLSRKSRSRTRHANSPVFRLCCQSRLMARLGFDQGLVPPRFYSTKTLFSAQDELRGVEEEAGTPRRTDTRPISADLA